MIRVLVVDDSSAVRTALQKALPEDGTIEVVGAASDPLEAWDRLPELAPDVVTLDIEMPGMDGLTFLGRLMRARPMPVVMVSSLIRKDPTVSARALAAGAVAVVEKPHAAFPMELMLQELRLRIVEAARRKPSGPSEVAELGQVLPAARARQTMIAVGGSTGGTSAFETFVRGLPQGHPGVVLSQHLPVDFVPRFASRLGKLGPSRVAVARTGDEVAPGTILLCPATHHLEVKRDGLKWVTNLIDAPPIQFFRPNIDLMMTSVARAAGPQAVGVLLTGMGADGAEGMLAIRRAGGFTLAQDEATSVVYGMPRAAKENGGAVEQLPLGQLARRALQMLTVAPLR